MADPTQELTDALREKAARGVTKTKADNREQDYADPEKALNVADRLDARRRGLKMRPIRTVCDKGF